jgi:nitrous oxidase accessory protein NosD
MKGCDKQWAFTLVGLCVIFCFSKALTAPASAVQYYVNHGESIQAAVDNASDGTYTENIDVNKRLTIRSDLATTEGSKRSYWTILFAS